MSWLDRLQEASLGGVAFLAQSSRVSVGRRSIVIELPNRDQPEYEDMGRAARRCSITAFILGDDYDRDRARLAEVLETKGPHTFVNPWWGESKVIVEGAGEFEEMVDRGRGCSVSLTLTEAGAQTAVTATIVPSAAMSAAIDAAAAAALQDFESEYEVGVGDSFSRAAAALGEATDQIDSVNNKIAAALGIADGVIAAMDEAKEAAADLIGSPAALASTLAGLLSSVTALLGLTTGIEEEYPGQASKIAADTALAAAQQLGAIDVTAEPPYPGGPLLPEAEASTRAIGKLIRTQALIGVSGTFRTLPLESAAAAGDVLATLGALTDDLLADETTGDDLAAALTDLRAALQQHLGALVDALPAATEYTPPGAVPALFLAWQMYGDPTRDIEICARNNVADPNFLPGGVPLEVLGA